MATRLTLLALLVLTGCLDHDLPEDASDGGAAHVFIALPSDFRNFLHWKSFELAGTMHVDVEGPLVAYVNQLPEQGASEFPIGTIIVKALEAGEPSEWMIHGMAKRGGDFNPRGAYDWEFFELGFSKKQVPIISWRGAEPPSGENYRFKRDGVVIEAECNTCHLSTTNDAVLSPELDLEELP